MKVGETLIVCTKKGHSSIRKLPFSGTISKSSNAVHRWISLTKSQNKKKKKKKKEVAAALVTLVEARFIDHSKLKGIYGFRERNMPSCVCVCVCVCGRWKKPFAQIKKLHAAAAEQRRQLVVEKK